MQLCPIIAEGAEEAGTPAEILQVLEENQQVFQTLPLLPPHRRYNHAITLKEGANIANLRPYRYPYY